MVLTRSRKRMRQFYEDGKSSTYYDPLVLPFLPKKARAEPIWLDKLPVDIREHIASFVVTGGKPNNDGLNLAYTSELQRRAVLSQLPDKQSFVVEIPELSDAWAELVADHYRDLSIIFLFPGNRFSASSHALYLPMLRSPRLEKLFIPGLMSFLDAIRDAEGLRELSVKMCSSSRRSLLAALRRRGPGLRSITFECEDTTATGGNPASSKCPMCLCSGNEANSLTSLCPNLEELVLKCRHIRPSTTVMLLSKLPRLKAIELCCPTGFIELSDEDISALKRLTFVTLENVCGGVRVAARIGKPVVSVRYLHRDEFDSILDLVKCPEAWEVQVAMSLENMKRFRGIIPQLPRLRCITLTLTAALSFEDVEKAVMEALKILRLCRRPKACVLLGFHVPDHREDSREQLDEITSKIAREGGKLKFCGMMGELMCVVSMKDQCAMVC